MNGSEFEQFMKKYLEGKLSEQEQKQIGQWLDAQQPEQPRRVWTPEEKAMMLAELHQKMQEGKKETRMIPFRRFMQAAAVFLILITASYYAWHNVTTPAMQVVVADTAIRKVILTDGTIVWLRQNSSLRYPAIFARNERHVVLSGEALFEVAKDSAHPFVVQCGDLTATVLGTSFSIKTGNEQTEVTVLTGKVNLSSQHDKKGIDILPRERAWYSPAEQTISKVNVQQRELEEATSSTDYNMHFEGTAMPEIIQRIEGKFNVSVNTGRANITGCVITADFTDQSLESTMQKIAGLVDFEYTIQENVVTIRGGSCP